MKKKIGLTIFVIVCLVICYVVDQSNEYAHFPKTYGEYVKQQESEAVTANAKVSAMANKTYTENADAVEKKEEQKEIVKRAYLTFDDGPSANTKKILKILKENNIKATFFVIADEITPEYESLIREMIAEGHVVGVHSYTHNRKEIYKNKESCVEDIKKSIEKLTAIMGTVPVYYRFPYGSANCYITGFCNAVIRDLNDMGLIYIDWNVDTKDAVGTPEAYSIIKNVKSFEKYIEPVILLHDGKVNKNTVEALPDIISKIKAAGYEFGTMAERSKPYQWPHDWQKK